MAEKSVDELRVEVRVSGAYHEAAHAVVAYFVGWWVNHEGVEIDAREYHWRPASGHLRDRAVLCLGVLSRLARRIRMAWPRWPEIGGQGRSEARRDLPAQ
jgi:hypothetical protein